MYKNRDGLQLQNTEYQAIQYIMKTHHESVYSAVEQRNVEPAFDTSKIGLCIVSLETC